MTDQRFKKLVYDYYKKYGRHDLPWRHAITPYKVLVSEIMLQQTQVDRVIPYFKNWLKLFPDFKQLAHAPQHEVLRAWKGLGYNSRALRLHKLAQQVTTENNGRLPRMRTELESLPGVGPYIAGAVCAFAYNTPSAFIETNIRTVYMYHFFNNKRDVTDREILEKVDTHVPKTHARDWYAALMDYGSFLKRSGVKNNNQSKHYTKQKKFAGSDRQLRGKILDILLQQEKITERTLTKQLEEPQQRVLTIVNNLESEGFLARSGRSIVLK